MAMTDYDRGLLLGLLIGEAHFGGDGKQAQITVKMHIRHKPMFDWLVLKLGGKLYGPYLHGGRNYYQWMLRGQALRLALPILDNCEWPDKHSEERYLQMKGKYSLP